MLNQTEKLKMFTHPLRFWWKWAHLKELQNNNQQKKFEWNWSSGYQMADVSFFNKFEFYGHAWAISALYSLPLKINWWFFFESHVFWGADLENDGFILVKWSFHCQNLHFVCLAFLNRSCVAHLTNSCVKTTTLFVKPCIFRKT